MRTEGPHSCDEFVNYARKEPKMRHPDVILYGIGPTSVAVGQMRLILGCCCRLEVAAVQIKDRAAWALMGWSIWDSE